MSSIKIKQYSLMYIENSSFHYQLHFSNKIFEFSPSPIVQVYEENGSCSMLSRGVYACQSKTFLDPFNPYCMFMD
jgi:hypothetical protein